MIPLGLFGTFGFGEIVAVLIIVLLLFGARRIPDLARGLGEGIRNFRTGLRGDDRGEGESKREERDDTRR